MALASTESKDSHDSTTGWSPSKVARTGWESTDLAGSMISTILSALDAFVSTGFAVTAWAFSAGLASTADPSFFRFAKNVARV